MSTRRFGSGIVFAGLPMFQSLRRCSKRKPTLVVAEKLHVDGFVASNGWLESFKNARNISTMTVAGEETDVSPQTLESWKEQSKGLIKG